MNIAFKGTAALVAIVIAFTAAAATPVAASTLMCGQYQSTTVYSYGLPYVIDNDNFGGHPECLAVWGKPAFTVASSFTAPIGLVQAHPFVGTSAAPLPAHVYALGTPWVTWSYSTNDWGHMPQAPGGWNASIETWINKEPTVTGHVDGAEVMIWLRRQNIYAGDNSLPKVWVDGTWWYVRHWRAHVTLASGKVVYWNYVHFLRVKPVSTMYRLPIEPFYWRVEKMGLMSSSWYLETVQAGFEIYSGGQGLSTNWFRFLP